MNSTLIDVVVKITSLTLKNKILIGSFLVAGVVIGFVNKGNGSKVYKSNAIIRVNYIEKNVVENLLTNIKIFASNKNSDLPDEHLIRINNRLQNITSINVSSNHINIYDVKITCSDSINLDSLNKDFFDLIENNRYILKRKEREKEMLLTYLEPVMQDSALNKSASGESITLAQSVFSLHVSQNNVLTKELMKNVNRYHSFGKCLMVQNFSDLKKSSARNPKFYIIISVVFF